MPRCKSCRKPIEYLTLESGKKIPVDLEITPAWSGLMGQNAIIKIHDRPAFAARIPKEGPFIELFITHFATCPNAAAHRKAKS